MHNPLDMATGVPGDASTPYRGEFYVVNPGGSAVCEFIHEGQADANLIAAAHDLLEACEMLLLAAERGERSWWHAERAARTTIAKAKGRK
jgi:hypothetical protein